MLKSAFVALSLTVSSLAIASPVIAQTGSAKAVPATVDPVRLKFAEQTVAKLIPVGTYTKIMKDMMDTMAGGMVEQMMEAMPAMMKKVEPATAHLPPLPKSDVEMAIESAAEEMAEAAEGARGTNLAETGDERWYNEDKWTPANRKKGSKLANAYEAAKEKTEKTFAAFEQIQMDAIDEARKRYLANGWKPDPHAPVASEEKPMAFEDIAANAVPLPAAPK